MFSLCSLCSEIHVPAVQDCPSLGGVLYEQRYQEPGSNWPGSLYHIGEAEAECHDRGLQLIPASDVTGNPTGQDCIVSFIMQLVNSSFTAPSTVTRVGLSDPMNTCDLPSVSYLRYSAGLSRIFVGSEIDPLTNAICFEPSK